MPTLDKTKIPAALHGLIPTAMEWGINDDHEREQKLSRANASELLSLVASIDSIAGDDLFGWLGGPESVSLTPSHEYGTFTCLTMAIDSAKLKLRRMPALER